MRAERPAFPSVYGIHDSAEGMLGWDWAEERLAGSRNYWICTTRPDGSPHAAPVWGLWHDGAVVFSTSPASRKGRNLEHDPRVTVHLDSGDEVVIVEGVMEEIELDDATADAYKAKYGFRPSPGRLWCRVRPRLAHAWLEAEYPRTATRFSFD